ncbi:hypothetical protein PRIPAC_78781 [Pristionchus pacificus]|uniref:Transmembrane ion channel n=1 Tax=Pristionchus pacificus TaxID=54126 RepID=A0A2A6BXC4_PRIPA|nr:hypothetical protein PRIPAC_78781 [Pristionchus pacificus]|eukprot:PDM70413.1 transmembrane ion channel [Pristionchus pacificus]
MAYLLLCLLISFIGGSSSQKQPKVNADFILQRMMNESYDIRVRPPATDEKGNTGPVDVDVNIFIRSLSNIDFVSMNYDLQITFREKWKDPRLSYDYIQGDVPAFIVMTDKDAIWRPDTFFQNEKRAHRHEIDKPNVLIRIEKDGSILFSERLTLTLSCPMHLAMFPLDVQHCHLDMASYAYSTEDLIYKWAKIAPIQFKVGVHDSLPSFTLDQHETSVCTSKTNTGEYSCLRVTFRLARQFSYYVVQVYIPSTLLVIVSWVSFWLDRAAVPARVTLGVTTLLTMTTQAAAINNKLPPVSYIKAIDVWIGACLIFIFAAVLEYAYVTYVANQCDQRAKMMSHSCSGEKSSSPLSPMEDSGPKREEDNLLSHSHSITNIDCFLCSMFHDIDEGKMIDTKSRIVFPLAFIVFNILYWVGYCMNAQTF